jgi:hypothetical protein
MTDRVGQLPRGVGGSFEGLVGSPSTIPYVTVSNSIFVRIWNNESADGRVLEEDEERRQERRVDGEVDLRHRCDIRGNELIEPETCELELHKAGEGREESTEALKNIDL